MRQQTAGKPEPLNDSLNNSRTIFGLDLTYLLAAIVVAVLAFLLMPNWTLKLASVAAFAIIIAVLGRISAKEPKIFSLLAVSYLHGTYYDPGKE